MTEYLTPQGYEQARSKLINLERRLAQIEARNDLSPVHLEQVVRSYREMMHQYRREIKLYEAMQEQTSRTPGEIFP